MVGENVGLKVMSRVGKNVGSIVGLKLGALEGEKVGASACEEGRKKESRKLRRKRAFIASSD